MSKQQEEPASNGAKQRLGRRIVPALLARNMEETLGFYELLGFSITGRSSESPQTWAEVTSGDVAFQFHTEPPGGTPASPVCSGTFYLYPEDVSALANDLRDKVEFAWGPEDMDYGMFEFGVKDPNGYFLAFTAPTGAT